MIVLNFIQVCSSLHCELNRGLLDFQIGVKIPSQVIVTFLGMLLTLPIKCFYQSLLQQLDVNVDCFYMYVLFVN